MSLLLLPKSFAVPAFAALQYPARLPYQRCRQRMGTIVDPDVGTTLGHAKSDARSDDLRIGCGSSKSGGFNARASSIDEFTRFEPEKVWACEVGLRSEWLEKRLRFNADRLLKLLGHIRGILLVDIYANA